MLLLDRLTLLEKYVTLPVGELWETYEKLLLKRGVLTLDILFNKECLRGNIIPKYVSIKLKPVQHNVLIESFAKAIIHREIKMKYNEKSNLYNLILVIQRLLMDQCHPVVFEMKDQKIRTVNSTKLADKSTTLHMKIATLLQNQHPSDQTPSHVSFKERVVNMSDIQLTSEELDLLSKGPKYSLKSNSVVNDKQTLIIDINTACSSINTKYEAIEKVNHLKSCKKTTEINTVKSLQSKIKQHDVVVTSADKSHSIVLLNRNHYNSKVQDFITKEKATPIRDPTPSIDKEVRKFLRYEAPEIIQNPKSLVNKNPSAPRLYGTVKIHKANESLPINDVPIRPVVSSFTSPVYLLEKELVRLFNTHVSWKSTHSISNRSELIDAIKNIDCPANTQLISLDVNSLFSKVNVPVAVSKLQYLVHQHSNWSPAEKEAYKHALELVTKSNYFQFNGCTYQQLEGCSMGSPLSPLLAEIYMSDFENELFNSNSPFLADILIYKRYVDDIFILWTNTKSKAQDLLNHLNQLRENIKFDLEIATNNGYSKKTIEKLFNSHLDKYIQKKYLYTTNSVPIVALKMSSGDDETCRLL
ncbi:hypothetical protein M8J77_021478 [Diaphorina citri]|nr:hypothetical protein M8J77_021478 [Diaphorina citri]